MPPTMTTGCEHCPPGLKCDPLTGACIKGKSKTQQNYSNLIYKFVNVANFIIHNTSVLLFCPIPNPNLLIY